MRSFKTLAMLAAILGLATVASAAWVATEDFEDSTAYPNNVAIGLNADWYAANSGPQIRDNIGVASSRGLYYQGNIFTWSAHPFSWTNDLAVGDKVVAAMDFKTTASTQLDDDRVGWMTKDNSTGSDFIFGIQFEVNASSGGNRIEGYWDHVISVDKDKRPVIMTLPTMDPSTWYRLTADIIKLSDTSARIDVDVSLVGGASIASGSILDTSALGALSPDVGYFTGTAGYGNNLWPAYKNYNNGEADNAYFEVTPEPATMGLLALGGLALLRRRRKAA